MLFNKNFKLLVLGEIITVFGSSMLRFVLGLYILDTTGRADIFATLMAISTLPAVLISPIGGAVADRFNKRNLMVGFDFFSAIIVLIFALFIHFSSSSLILVGSVMTLMGIINALEQPTNQSCISFLVKEDEIVQANGIISGIGAISPLAAPVLGGILYSALGFEWVIGLSGISFATAATFECFIHIPFTKPVWEKAVVPTIINDMKKGVQYIGKDNPYILKIMFLAAGLNLFLTPFFIVGVPYILKVVMAASDTMFGISEGLIQLSTILGALGIGLVGKKMKMKTFHLWLAVASCLLLPMSFAVSAGFLSKGFFPSYILFFLCAVPVLIILTMLSVFAISIVQKETPDNMIGKVMSIITSVAQCMAPIGQLLYGALFATFSTHVSVPILIAAFFTFVLAIVANFLLNTAGNKNRAHS